MDLTSIAVAAAGAVITAATPVVVAFAVAYGKRALAALETSKYADAYSRLDPVVQSAIEAAAAEAMTRAIDVHDTFGKRDVYPLIADRAAEAVNAIGKAAGVRIDLQPQHIAGLAALAADEVLTELAEVEEHDAPDERLIPPAGEAFSATDYGYGDSPVVMPGASYGLCNCQACRSFRGQS